VLDILRASLHTRTIMINLTPAQLRKAADIQEKIQSLQEELGQILGGEVSTLAQTIETPKKRKVSAAGKARMRAAQIARWAKIKGTAPEAKPAQEPKNKMSAQGLANIRAGVAKRMAAQGKAVQKPKRKMTAAWRKALERAWAARRAKGKAARKA
jgi:hypothetical protein